jgi:LAGLIDADG endonuclease
MQDFPMLKSASKPIYVKSNIELSEFWISDYFSIYCNFKVDLSPYGWKKFYYNRVVSSFNFSRSIKEYMLMEVLASYFNVTLNIRSDNSRVDVNVYSLEKLRTVVDLFVIFPLQSSKQKEFIL